MKTHVSSVPTRLGLRDRVQAVVYAFEAGLVQPHGRTEAPSTLGGHPPTEGDEPQLLSHLAGASAV